MAGRKPAKDYQALYPGWPEVDPATIDDPIDKRLLILFTRVQAEFARLKDNGTVTSFKDFARFLDLPSALVHNLLNGRSVPSVETMFRIEEKMRTAVYPPFATPERD